MDKPLLPRRTRAYNPKPKRSIVRLWSSNLSNLISCPGCHILREYKNRAERKYGSSKMISYDQQFFCDCCNKRIPEFEILHACRECDYDLCSHCYESITNPKIPKFDEKINEQNNYMSYEDRRLRLLAQIKGISMFKNKKVRDDGIKLLLKILTKILYDPYNIKYQNLNFDNVHNKFNCGNFMNILFTLGFQKCKEKKIDRLKMQHFSAYFKDFINLIWNAYHKLTFVISYFDENTDMHIDMQNNCLLFIIYAFLRNISDSVYSDIVHLVYVNIGTVSAVSNVLIVEEHKKVILDKENIGRVPNTNIFEFESIWIMKGGILEFASNDNVIKCYNNIVIGDNAKISGNGVNFEIQCFGQIILKKDASIKSNGFSMKENAGNIAIKANNVIMDKASCIQAIGKKYGKISISIPKYREINLVIENINPKTFDLFT
eukprot:159309_1